MGGLFDRIKETVQGSRSGASRRAQPEGQQHPGTSTGDLGVVRGYHYTEWVEPIKQLKREERHEEAISLLWECVKATETEHVAGEISIPAPWYYEQLAIIYRKQGELDQEVATLERCVTQSGGEPRAEVSDRLRKAKAKLENTYGNNEA